MKLYLRAVTPVMRNNKDFTYKRYEYANKIAMELHVKEMSEKGYGVNDCSNDSEKSQIFVEYIKSKAKSA